MEQKMKFDLTDRDCQFLSKFRESIKDSDAVSYFGWMDALTSIVYRIQKLACVQALTEEKGCKEISSIIDDVEKDIVEVCGLISAGVKEHLDELLAEDAKNNRILISKKSTMKQKIKITRSEKVKAFEKAMNDAFTKIGDMTGAEMYTCLSVLAFDISRNFLCPEMTEKFGAEGMAQEVVNFSIAYGGLGAYTAIKDAFPDVDVECASIEKISDSGNCYFTIK